MTTDVTVDLTMRFAYKNGKGVIDQVTQPFVLTISAEDLSTENDCSAATINTEWAERAGN
jgi:hypothetical protein